MVADAFKVLKGEGARGNEKIKVKVVQKNGRVSYDRGCWQLNSYYYKHVPDSEAYNADASAKRAHEIYQAHGFSRWCSANKVLGIKSC